MNLFLVFLIAISLSMDAFSLALAYGTLGMNSKDKLLLSLITGCFHFFMPLLGFLIGDIILNIDSNLIVTLILCFIGIDMIISSFKKENIKEDTPKFFLFALAVSIDSFSVGITLTEISSNIIMCSIIFSFVSYFFTYIGLVIGNKIEKLVGNIATIIGGMFLIILGLCYMV